MPKALRGESHDQNGEQENEAGLDVRVHVQPAELFLANSIPVEQIAVTDHYTFVRRQAESGQIDYVMHDANGRKIDFSEANPALTIDGDGIADFVNLSCAKLTLA